MSDNTIIIWIGAIGTGGTILCAIFAFLTWRQGARQQPKDSAMNRQANPGWFIASAILFTGCLACVGVGLYAWIRVEHPWILLMSVMGLVILLILTWVGLGRLLASVNPGTKREFEKLADEDSAGMSKRLVLCGTSAKLFLETVEPYIDVVFRILTPPFFP